MEGSSSKNKRKQLFVPIHESKKNKKKGTEALLANIENSVTEMKEIVKNDPSRELLEFLKSESEQQKRSDELYLQTLQAMTTPPQQPHYAYYSQHQIASYQPQPGSSQQNLHNYKVGSFIRELNEDNMYNVNWNTDFKLYVTDFIVFFVKPLRPLDLVITRSYAYLNTLAAKSFKFV